MGIFDFLFKWNRNKKTEPTFETPPEAKTEQKPEKKPAPKPTPKPKSKPKPRPKPKVEVDAELVVGFDFGTAFSKVVIRDYSHGVVGKSYAVSFGSLGSSRNEYLIPARIFYDGDNSISLSSNSGEEISNLKLGPLNHQSCSEEDDQFAAGYIALVLRETRRWFFSNYGDSYKNRKIIWSLNIGLPSRSYEDEELCSKFRSLAIAGWALSTESEPLTIENINQKLNIARNFLSQSQQPSIPSGFLHRDDINVVPEIIAEVVGYAKSDLRVDGLHMVLDIGASTTDLASFIIHQDNDNLDDNYEILTAEVENFGVISFDNAKNEGHDSFESLRRNFYTFIGNTNREMRDRRCRNDWMRGFPFFMCGGGSKIKFYQDIVKTINGNLISTAHFSGFDYKQIPKPSDLEAHSISIDSYHRLAVAYGLSFRKMDIGRIVPKSVISDMPPPPPPSKTRTRYYQDKEDHYWGT